MQQITVREAIRAAIKEEMYRDDKVFVMGEEVGEYQGAYKITQGLLEEFGAKRIVDTPISEHGFTGIGIGAAFNGLSPIVEFMSFNFSMQAMDQIINSAAKTHYMSGGQLRCPIVFRGPNGAAAQVAAQHSQCYASWYAHIPGLKVIAPYHAGDFKGLLKTAIRDPNPIIFLENEILYGFSNEIEPEVLEKDYLVPIGKALIRKIGKDLTIIAFSLQVKYALEAATILEKDHITAEVIDLRTIRPLDIETIINSIKKTHRVIVIEEGWPFAGVTSEIITIIIEKGFDDLDAPPIRVTAKDTPLPYSTNLEKNALPQTNDIVNAAKNILLI